MSARSTHTCMFASETDLFLHLLSHPSRWWRVRPNLFHLLIDFELLQQEEVCFHVPFWFYLSYISRETQGCDRTINFCAHAESLTWSSLTLFLHTKYLHSCAFGSGQEDIQNLLNFFPWGPSLWSLSPGTLWGHMTNMNNFRFQSQIWWKSI